MWGRGVRGNNVTLFALCWFSVTSPTTLNQIGPFWCWFLVGGFVYILGPCGSLQWTLLWVWVFLPPPQPPQVFSVRGFEDLFLHVGTLGCVVCFAPKLFLLVYLHAVVGLPTLPATASTTPVLQPLPCGESSLPGCLSPPLLLVWMNVSSLTPWLSDFHTVWFSVSSGCFLFLNLLLSFFWLFRAAKCTYLCLHLGWTNEIS